MKQKIYKRLMVAGVSGMTAGVGIIGYSFLTKSVDTFLAGAVFLLAGTQCAMNSHFALLRTATRGARQP